MESEVRLKQKCNILIDRAKEKEKALWELQQILYDLLEQKANLEMRLKEKNEGIGGGKKERDSLKWLPAIRKPAELMVNSGFEQTLTISVDAGGGVQQVTQEQLLNLFVEFGNQLNAHLDEAIDKKIEDKINRLNLDVRTHSQNDYDRAYLGLSDEVAIIYEHGKFYHILSKIGYIVALGFVLIMMALAVISVATLG